MRGNDSLFGSTVERGILHVEWTEDPSEWRFWSFRETGWWGSLDPNPPQSQSMILDSAKDEL